MYAVVKSGGKQYKVAVGQTFKLEKIESSIGDQIILDEVLLVSTDEGIKLGDSLKTAKVHAEVVAHGRNDKIKIIKFRRRKHSRKQQGHRQWFTQVKISNIEI
ncbi:MAG: 50S ribosomal protein L21 [Psittacicella sp.]